MNNFYGYQPFPTGSDDIKCDPDASEPLSLLRCPALDGCDIACGVQDNKFLNCYIVSFTTKLGYGASESSITIELVEAYQLDSCYDCTDDSTNGVCVYLDGRGINADAITAEECTNSGNSKWICGLTSQEFDANLGVYNGYLGHIYTFRSGNFSFRGILSNHQYRESEAGYRYTVTLSDSRQILDSVKVIVGGYYADVPPELKFNLINALYDQEPSLTDENEICKGLRCKDFTVSGNNHRGMLLVKALNAVNNKYCELPISKGCLSIDVTDVINICTPYLRVTSNEMSVLELISLACNESGHEFYTKIEGNTIKVYVISQKDAVSGDSLFNFIESIDKNILIERDYGQELTFEKSKKFIIGDNYRYLLMLDETEDCAESEPKTSGAPACSVGFIQPGTHEYKSANMDFVQKISDIVQTPAHLAPPGSGTCDPNDGGL